MAGGPLSATIYAGPVTVQDRERWDRKYAERDPDLAGVVQPPALFADFADLFPISGTALDIACGRGSASVWLAERGLQILGIDISPVAIDQARDLASRSTAGKRCQFEVIDLDAGLPAGLPVDVVLCLRFRDGRLDQPIIDRLAPCGLLAVSALSEVGGAAGAFRAKPGELLAAFAGLDVIASGESDGLAWLLARKPSGS
jgi:SAM-dependent methyltransferase